MLNADARTVVLHHELSHRARTIATKEGYKRLSRAIFIKYTGTGKFIDELKAQYSATGLFGMSSLKAFRYGGGLRMAGLRMGGEVGTGFGGTAIVIYFLMKK